MTDAEKLIMESKTDEALKAELDTKMEEMVGEWQARREGALKGFAVKKVDDVEGIKTYAPPKAPKYMNSMTTVHGGYRQADGVEDLTPYVVFNYAGDRWVFWERLVIKADDLRPELSGMQPDRDNAGGTVGEILRLGIIDLDTNMGRPLIPVAYLRSIVAAEKVVIRFEGERYHDHELKGWEKTSLEQVLVLQQKRPGPRDAAAALLAVRQALPPEGSTAP